MKGVLPSYIILNITDKRHHNTCSYKQTTYIYTKIIYIQWKFNFNNLQRFSCFIFDNIFVNKSATFLSVEI